MPIQITISGETAIQALRELRGLSSGLCEAAPAPAPAEDSRPVAEEVPADEERTFPEEPAKRRGRPPKAKPETVEAEEKTFGRVDEQEAPPFGDTSASAESSESEAKSAPATPTEASSGSAANASPSDDQVFTVDDARAALTDLLAQPNGKDMAKAVFGQFGAAKLSDLKETDLKGFIAAIAKARGL